MIVRHKNIDYSICKSVSYKSEGIPKAMIIYDVACQWYKNFTSRVDRAPALSWPKDMKLVPVMVEEAPTSFSPFSLVDCTLLSDFSFNDFVIIAFLDLARDLDTQI